jgi:tetratricopeptide (TPR) repeat protein
LLYIGEESSKTQSEKFTHNQDFYHNLGDHNIDRNGNFIGREDDLVKLHEMLQGQALQGAHLPTVLIVGMAGMGKSELARQYGKLHLHDFSGGVGIVNAAHFAEEIMDFMQPRFCEDRDLRYERTLKAQVAEGWQAWQKFCGVERLALIVIDDVTDYQTQVAPYLPKISGDRNPFRFVLTSRSQLRGNLAVHEIKELTNDAAVQVLAKWAEPNQQTVLENPAIAKSLCDRLGCLPLALTLVGSWLSIAERTLAMAIAALEKEGLASAVLEPDREDIRQKAERGLKAAFAMSWKPLSTDAQQLGRVLSLFEPINLPWELVESVVQAYLKQSALPTVRKSWWKIWDNPMVQIESPFVPIRDLMEARIALRKTSLLQSVEQGKTYRLHRLVHEFLSEQWQDGDRDGWQDAWLRGLSDRANEIPAFAAWDLVTAWQHLRPHFGSAQKFIEARLKSATNPALVSTYKLQKNNLIGGSFRLNQAPIFEATYRQAQSTHDRAKAALAKGETAAAQSYFGEAIKGYQRAIEQARAALPKDSMILAGYLHQIAGLFYELGNYREGIPPAEESVEIGRFKASPLRLAIYFNNLAALYDSQGRYSEAEPLFVSALDIRERQLGANHSDVAVSLDNLGLLYYLQGRYSEAESLYKRSFHIYERQTNGENLGIAQNLTNLASLYKLQGKYSKAESLHLRSLDIVEKELGSDHPDIAHRLSNLAELYESQRRYSEAEPLLLRSLDIYEQKLGVDYPEIARTLNNLAELYRETGRHNEAEPLYLRSLDIIERKLGEDHPNISHVVNNLASLYRIQKHYNEAENLYLKAIEIRERYFGKDHLDVATSLNRLAGLYSSQGKYSEAEPLYVRSLAIFMQSLGQDHPNTQTVMSSLMMLRLQMSTGMSSETLQQMITENPDDIIRFLQDTNPDN